MDNRDLSPSEIERYKAACDQAVQSIGTPSQVAALLGLSPSTLSKAINPELPDNLLTVACAIRLERLSRRPIFAAFFAGLTYHHVVADDGEPGGGGGRSDFVGHISSISKEHSEAVISLAEVAQRPTPAAARRAMKEIGDSLRVMHDSLDHLAPIAAKAGG